MHKHLSYIKYALALSIIFTASLSHAGLFDFKTKEKEKVEVGSEAPQFSGESFRKKEKFDYEADLKGNKVIMLDFWSIYCVSCLKEIPKLVDIYEKYKDRDITFIYVDLDTNTRRLKMFLKDPSKNNIDPIIMDKIRAIANAFDVNILPTTLVIGKDGKIKFYHEGYKPGDEHEIEKVIQKLTN